MATRVEEGRRRWHRTRDAIVEAACQIIEETWALPSPDAVAERAGVSRRTVFHHFPDREQLASGIIDVQEARMVAHLPALVESGPVAARLDAFAARRSLFLERLFPYRRAAQALEVLGKLPERQALLWKLNRDEVERAFSKELAAAGDEGDEVAVAVQAASSWLAWDALRRLAGLDPAGAAKVMRRTVAAVLRDGSRGRPKV